MRCIILVACLVLWTNVAALSAESSATASARGPFSEMQCGQYTRSSFQDYRNVQMTDAFHIIDAMSVDEIEGLFEDKEELIDHILIQAPWMLDGKAVVFGSFSECYTLLRQTLDTEEPKARQQSFESWASCIDRAFPEATPAVQAQMDCLEVLVSK